MLTLQHLQKTQKATNFGLIKIPRLVWKVLPEEDERKRMCWLFSRLAREQLGGSAVVASGYPGINMSIQL